MRTLMILIIVLLLPIVVIAQDSLNVSMVATMFESWHIGEEIDVAGNYAYVLTEATGLRIVDISDSYSPVEIGYLPLNWLPYSISVEGDYAYRGGLLTLVRRLIL